MDSSKFTAGTVHFLMLGMTALSDHWVTPYLNNRLAQMQEVMSPFQTLRGESCFERIRDYHNYNFQF